MKNYTDVNEIEMQQEERIMSFLRGEMLKEEEAAFMEELQNNPGLKDKAIALARLAKGMKQVGEENDKALREALRSADEETIGRVAAICAGQENKPPRVIPFKKQYAAILSIAASICLIVYLGFQFNKGNDEMGYLVSLGNQYAEPFQSIRTPEDGGLLRGGDITEEDNNIEKEVEELVNNVYSNKDLDNTLKRLAELWKDSTSETDSDYSDYAPQIGWALATGYIKVNNKKDAIYILEEMSTLYDESMSIGEKVRNLQETLKKHKPK